MTMQRNKRLTGNETGPPVRDRRAFICLARFPPSRSAAKRLVDSWKPIHYDVDLTFNDQLTEIEARTDILLKSSRKH